MNCCWSCYCSPQAAFHLYHLWAQHHAHFLLTQNLVLLLTPCCLYFLMTCCWSCYCTHQVAFHLCNLQAEHHPHFLVTQNLVLFLTLCCLHSPMNYCWSCYCSLQAAFHLRLLLLTPCCKKRERERWRKHWSAWNLVIKTLYSIHAKNNTPNV